MLLQNDTQSIIFLLPGEFVLEPGRVLSRTGLCKERTPSASKKRGAPRCLRRASQVQAHLLLVSSLPHSKLPPGLGGALFGKAAKARPFRTQSVSAHSQRSQNLYFLWVGRAFLPSIQNSIFCAIIEPYVPEPFGKLLISLRAVWTEVKKLGNFMPVHSL